MKMIKTLVWFVCATLSLQLVGRGAESVSDLFQRGLLEEEANRNLPAAIQAYEEVVKQIDSQRRLAATAIFRLGETYRKLGRTNDAVRSYERLLKDFPDESALSALSRQNLAGLGFTGTTDAASREAGGAAIARSGAAIERQRALIKQEIELVLKQQQDIQKKVESGVAPKDSILAVEREILQLKRQLEAVGEEKGRGTSQLVTPVESDSDEEDFEIRRLKKLLANSPDLLNAPNNGLTPLQKAAVSGQLRVVEFLLTAGASRDFGGSRRLSALHFAAASGHKTIVDRLLQEGSPVNAAASGGVTPLHCAAAAGNRLIVARLLDAKPFLDPVTVASAEVGNARVGKGHTPLSAAIDQGHADIVDQLLAAGANINGGSSNAIAPVIVAIGAKRADLLLRLLESGASPNGVDGAQPPLDIAVNLGDTLSVKLLLHKGATPHRSTNKEMPLLHMALSYKMPDLEIIKLLLEAGADPNEAIPGSQLTPLGVAARAKDRGGLDLSPHVRKRLREAIVLLLEYKADLRAALDSSFGDWFGAVFEAEEDGFLQSLVAHGMDIDRTYNGETLLQVACRDLQPQKVASLLELKANPNLRMPGAGTALNFVQRTLSSSGSLARQRSNEAQAHAKEIRDLLLRHGAKLDVPNLAEIQVRRGDNSAGVFRRGTNDWNQFTFYELLAAVYLEVPTGCRNDLARRTSVLAGHHYQFPALGEVVIQRANEDGTRKEISPNMENVPLEWGDIVELPEGVHAVNSEWRGLDSKTKALLTDGIRRQVKLRIGGKEVELSLTNRFTLKSVITEGNFLLTSSEPREVQVTGARSKTGRPRISQWKVNIADLGTEPDFWLRDGDEIEVPNRVKTP